jgi:hypothetical protein
LLVNRAYIFLNDLVNFCIGVNDIPIENTLHIVALPHINSGLDDRNLRTAEDIDFARQELADQFGIGVY